MTRAMVFVPTQVDSGVRTSAAVMLKNEIKKHWEPPGSPDDESEQKKEGSYTAEEKQLIRDNIYATLVQAASSLPISQQLLESIRLIALHDYPSA